jgi:hypothetical protein
MLDYNLYTTQFVLVLNCSIPAVKTVQSTLVPIWKVKPTQTYSLKSLLCCIHTILHNLIDTCKPYSVNYQQVASGYYPTPFTVSAEIWFCIKAKKYLTPALKVKSAPLLVFVLYCTKQIWEPVMFDFFFDTCGNNCKTNPVRSTSKLVSFADGLCETHFAYDEQTQHLISLYDP